MQLETARFSIIGPSYCGLPVVIKFGKQRHVLGFDISTAHLTELQSGQGHTLETSPEGPAQAKHLTRVPPASA